MFRFKPIITGSPVMMSSNGMELTRFDSMSKASTSTGIPYVTLLYAKKNSRKGPQWPGEHQSAPIEFALMEKNIQ